MPVYSYKCQDCDATETKVRKIDHRHNPVACAICAGGMELYVTPVLVNTSACHFDAFEAVGIKGKPVITNERQRKNFMAKHDLLDANETFAPPTHTEQKREHEKVLESVKEISNGDGLSVPDIV